MPKSALVVDITPLKRTTGAQRRFELATPPPGDLALESAEVTATELHIDVQLEMVGEELIAQGTITVDWNGPCRRCLERQDGRTEIELREIFQLAPVDGETYLLNENDVDLEPMVREAVLLNMPVAPLCSDDCAGPDPRRFPTTVAADPEPSSDNATAEPIGDPRWAALSEISFDN